MRFTLPSFLLSLLFTFLFLLASFMNYKRRRTIKYNMKNMFPFELNYRSSFSNNIYGNISLILSSLSFAFFYATYDIGFTNGLFLTVRILGIASIILFAVLCFLPFEFLRVHLLFFSLFMVTSFAIPVFTAIGSYVYNQTLPDLSTLVTIVFWISILMVIVIFALLLNPKLTFNFKMKEEIQEDGTKITVRPNILVVAFTEWMLYLFYIINSLILFILSFSL